MIKEEINSLSNYSVKIDEINKIIVSIFPKNNNIKVVKNDLVSNLIISKDNDFYKTFVIASKKLKIVTFDDLIKAFEFVISPKEKIITGAVYTPEPIRKNIITKTFSDNSYNNTFRICDPACGCGGFLLSSIEILKKTHPSLTFHEIFKKHIFGLDLKEYSVERTKILLSLYAILNGEDKNFSFNIFSGNALNFDWKSNIDNFLGFDVIVGNPPYVASRNIEKESFDLLKNWSVCKTGHPDLYIPFFEIGLSILKPKGTLGFITMNSFFKSLNGRALREYLGERKNELSITDFGSTQIFSSRNTYTCICLIKNINSDEIFFRKVESIHEINTKKYSTIKYKTLDNFKGWNLRNPSLINKIEKTGLPLKKIYKVNSGIATLKNNIYILDNLEEDSLNYILPCGGKIEKSICASIINPNKLIKSNNINSLKRKIIFPYHYKKNEASLIPLDELKRNYPNTFEYLTKNKDELNKRDKGNGSYEEWYAFGRKQGMIKSNYKLFFPHITNKIPNYILSNEEGLLFHNGLAILSDDKESLKVLKKIMSSRIFWFYITNTSKPYGSGYYSLSNNYIKSFGIYQFNKKEKEILLNLKDQEKIDSYLEELYNIDLS